MAVLQPTDMAGLAEAIASARDSLEIVGHGSKRRLGRPVQAAATLSTAGLTGISLYEPAELVLGAGAGTPLAEIEAALAAQGQQLAFEPPDYGALLGATGPQTLGGVIACNLSGPRRIQAGAARDHLLGFRAVSGRGEIFKSGGRVVKNVTGYDLSKLMAGSYGTLAVLAEATVKVLPRPETACTVMVHGVDAVAAIEVMRSALASPHDVSGAAWLPGRIGNFGSDAFVALRLEGTEPSVAFRAAALRESLKATNVASGEASTTLWKFVRDAAAFAGDHDRIVWRMSVPPAAAAAVAGLPDAEYFLDWSGGLVWLAVPATQAAESAKLLRHLTARHGGHATLVRAPDDVRASLDVFEPLPPALATLSQRVKHSFDPRGILNPGRMYREF